MTLAAELTRRARLLRLREHHRRRAAELTEQLRGESLSWPEWRASSGVAPRWRDQRVPISSYIIDEQDPADIPNGVVP